METLPSQSLLQLQLPCSFRSPSCVNNEQAKNGVVVVAENKKHRIRPLTVKRFPRRVFLQFMGFFKFNSLLFLSEPASVSAAPLPDMNDSPEVIRTLKLPSGVRIQEIIEGEGEEAKEGNTVQINYVCRRSNGYFVHSTVDQFSGESSPVILPLDENRIIRGLKEVLIGMRVGGKRRALIPPSVGYVNENLKPIPEEVIKFPRLLIVFLSLLPFAFNLESLLLNEPFCFLFLSLAFLMRNSFPIALFFLFGNFFHSYSCKFFMNSSF